MEHRQPKHGAYTNLCAGLSFRIAAPGDGRALICEIACFSIPQRKGAGIKPVKKRD